MKETIIALLIILCGYLSIALVSERHENRVLETINFDGDYDCYLMDGMDC